MSGDRIDDDRSGAAKLPRPDGLRPMIAASCRAALRTFAHDALDEGGQSEHVEALQHYRECPFCTSRVQAQVSLAEWLGARPSIPVALASPSVLEGVYERAAELAEHGAVGEWLEQSGVSLPSESDSSRWHEALGEAAAGNLALADKLLRAPALPDSQVWPQVWSGVRRSIRDGVASERRIRRRLSRRALLVAAAAAVIMGLIATFEVPALQPEIVPEIVFVDLDRAPGVDLAIVRYGSRH